MKIKSIRLKGFRGFNNEKSIEIDEKLTVIYAPNSYGKTSITEGLEWLLYGVTSKVEKGDSKEEYKGSYRNRHFPNDIIPEVGVFFISGEEEIEFVGQLVGGDNLKRILVKDGERREVEKWPFEEDIDLYPRPFIMQHALKYLLLTSPDDRFKRFAKLLGFEELDSFQKNIISLCTAPNKCFPVEVQNIVNEINLLERKIESSTCLQNLKILLRNNELSLVEIDKSIFDDSKNFLPDISDSDQLLSKLLLKRSEIIGKVYKGNISIQSYLGNEIERNRTENNLILNFVDDKLVENYISLKGIANFQYLLNKASFLDLGFDLFQESKDVCPFCGQKIDDKLMSHLSQNHQEISSKAQVGLAILSKKQEISHLIEEFREQTQIYKELHLSKSKESLKTLESLKELKKLVFEKEPENYQRIENSLKEIQQGSRQVEDTFNISKDILDEILASIDSSQEDLEIIKKLKTSLSSFIKAIEEYISVIIKNAQFLNEQNQLVQHEIDIIAGTEDISTLIDALDKKAKMVQKNKIESILEDLKDLRKNTDQFVANRILDIISIEFTSETMDWYNLIKTSGDPDVHFNGFDLEKSQKGDIKSRRVSVKAKSYDQDLVSAVSSLSESKLNALGLCVSISTNVNNETPFDFLVIDDPIQSLDSEHEVQFVEIIRKIINEYKKQVIILSHNKKWLESLMDGCRSLNCLYYEISSYSKEGPNIIEVNSVAWKGRLDVARSILENKSASSIQLQQAEEEIRIAITQITAEIYKQEKKIIRGPHSLNSREVQKILIQCGIENDLVNNVLLTFSTTDDSHHAPKGYYPNRDRIMKYISWTEELGRYIK